MKRRGQLMRDYPLPPQYAPRARLRISVSIVLCWRRQKERRIELLRISEHDGIAYMAEGRRIIMIHENPVDLLRPLEEMAGGLGQVGEVARAAKDSARDRNDMDLYQFFWRMEDKAHWLSEQLLQANDTTPLRFHPRLGHRVLLMRDCMRQCNRSRCIQPPDQCESSKRWQQVNSRKSSCGWTAFLLPVGSPSSRSLLSPYGKRNSPKCPDMAL